MRRLLAWLVGAAGGVAAYRALTRRRPARALPRPAGSDPRAEELRAKLAESREAALPGEPEPASAEGPEERRQHVHERGRAALDEMHRDGG
jgi:hypothetical protein